MRVSKMGERMEISRSEIFMELFVTAGGWETQGSIHGWEDGAPHMAQSS